MPPATAKVPATTAKMPPATADPDDVDMVDADELEREEAEANKLINEEYKTWKKNSPFLYDMILSTALTWPTLTVQWLPDVKEVPARRSRIHRVLLGTHTSENKPNHLEIAEVEIPTSVPPKRDDYDSTRGEFGSHTYKEATALKWRVVHQMEHPGEVNKARYCPQNPDLIATLAIDGRVLIYDRTKYPMEPDANTKTRQLEGRGHKQEGFGLSWNPHFEGKLASGSEDRTVCIWDINSLESGKKFLTPVKQYTHHTNVVNDVDHHSLAKNWFGSVSDDMTLQVVDMREASTDKAAIVGRHGHSDAINALAFHPCQEVLVATASADKTIGIWDLRNVKEKVHTLVAHQDAVTSVFWNPIEEGIIASAGYDRRILIWDLSRVGEEQQQEDEEDGPPELLFMHGGHTNHLTDFSWNPNEEWMIASAAEDNMLQVWKVSDNIVYPPEKGAAVGLDEVGR